MATRSGPPPIVYILAFLVLAGIGGWFFFKDPATDTQSVPDQTQVSNSQFPQLAAVPGGTVVRVDGSTSMVKINSSLRNGFQGQYPGTTVAAQANGSSRGIQALLEGRVDIAAISRPLKPQEQNEGLVAVPVTSDAIALVVRVSNPLSGGLTQAQVRDIFQGRITNWSAVGGPAKQIRVINRPSISGTHQVFKELVLNGGNFGTTPNITTMDRDATTPMLQALGDDGIGYATYDQVKTQTCCRAVAVDGTTPAFSSYPYQRQLYYVYKNPPSEAVKAFLGYVFSPQGQQAVAVAGS